MGSNVQGGGGADSIRIHANYKKLMSLFAIFGEGAAGDFVEARKEELQESIDVLDRYLSSVPGSLVRFETLRARRETLKKLRHDLLDFYHFQFRQDYGLEDKLP